MSKRFKNKIENFHFLQSKILGFGIESTWGGLVSLDGVFHVTAILAF